MRRAFLPLALALAGCDSAEPSDPDATAPADAAALDSAPAPLDAPAGDAAVPDAMCAPVVGAVVLEHACLHVMHGPHAAVTAGSDPATVTANVNAAHTHYAIALVGAAAPYHGAVVYRPGQAGAHALLVDPAVALRVTTAAGGDLPVIARHAVATCAGIAAAQVVQLERQVAYRLVVTGSAAPSLALLVENLDGFLPEDAWGQACP